jgi:DNA uptake protein ComE-like DNA-binding protein
MTGQNWLGRAFNPLKAKIRNDPYYRFRSLEEIALAAQLGIRINVSQAGVDDWLRLPGISIHQARMLVELVGMGVELLSLEDLAAALSVPVARLKVWEPILEFAYYSPESLLTPPKINPNTASIEQLKTLPLVSDDLATAIITTRQEQGLFKNIVDFKGRLSLDAQEISQLMHFIQF